MYAFPSPNPADGLSQVSGSSRNSGRFAYLGCKQTWLSASGAARKPGRCASLHGVVGFVSSREVP